MKIVITPETIIALAGALWSLIAWLRARRQLPAPLAVAIDKIGMERIATYIENAATYAEKTPGQRREWVVTQIIGLCKRESLVIPEGFIRLAVEWAYQKTIKARL